jgi:hypothetical protein
MKHDRPVRPATVVPVPETVRDVAPEGYGCTTVAPWPGRPGA